MPKKRDPLPHTHTLPQMLSKSVALSLFLCLGVSSVLSAPFNRKAVGDRAFCHGCQVFADELIVAMERTRLMNGGGQVTVNGKSVPYVGSKAQGFEIIDSLPKMCWDYSFYDNKLDYIDFRLKYNILTTIPGAMEQEGFVAQCERWVEEYEDELLTLISKADPQIVREEFCNKISKSCAKDFVHLPNNAWANKSNARPRIRAEGLTTLDWPNVEKA
jgi:hypothetical protein